MFQKCVNENVVFSPSQFKLRFFPSLKFKISYLRFLIELN